MVCAVALALLPEAHSTSTSLTSFIGGDEASAAHSLVGAVQEVCTQGAAGGFLQARKLGDEGEYACRLSKAVRACEEENRQP